MKKQSKLYLCEACRFSAKAHRFLFCYRYPPQILGRPVSNHTIATETASTYPRVTELDWCGEFKARKEK